MAGEVPIRRTLRIDNVEAAPVERITANDEERVRQGFEIQTVFAWPRRDGRPQVTEAEFHHAGSLSKSDSDGDPVSDCDPAIERDPPILILQYANSAEISRINKGLKRRREQTVLGFNIDPRTGYWARDESEESTVDAPPDLVKPVRIVPIVRDRKNALLFRFHAPDAYAPETIATLHHALMRGIEIVFQLEEGEVLGEPLPSRDERRAILAYEAAEGGAGVLSRLIEEPTLLGKVAHAALTLMHFNRVDEAIAAGDASLLTEREQEACVRGCYRCLLSYYNQPDHERIDRTSDQAKQLLIELARGRVVLSAASSTPDQDVVQADPWLAMFKQAGLPEPDAKAVRFADQDVPFAWRSHFVAAVPAPLTDAVREAAEALGWELFELPQRPAAGVPEAMSELLVRFDGPASGA